MTVPAWRSGSQRADGSRVLRRSVEALLVLTLLGACFWIQVRFFRHFPQPTLFGDPAGYYEIGQTFREGLALVRQGAGLREAFAHVRGGFDFLGIGLLFALLPSDRPEDVARFRLILAGANTLGMLGAGLLARRLSGSYFAGLLAIVAAGLHCGFSTDLGRLFPEPVTGCLCVWSAYLYARGLDERSPGWTAGAGLALSAALFVRAKLMPYLLILLGLALLVSAPTWRRNVGARRRIVAFLLGGLPLVLLWAGALRAVTGTVDARAPEWNLPGKQYYPYGFWQYLDSDGWEGPYRLKTEPFYQALKAAAQNDPQLLRSRPRQWQFTVGYVAARPWRSLLTVLDNAYRLHARPHNPYRWDYPLDYDHALLLHRAIVVCGLAGLLLAALSRPALAGVAFVPLALTVVYALAFPYTRYALPGLLILCAAAAAFVTACARRMTRASLGDAELRPAAVALAAGGGLMLLARVLRSDLPELARGLGWLGVATALAAPLCLAVALSAAPPRRRVWALAVGCALAGPLVAHALRDTSWHGSETRLGLETLAVRQEFVLGADGLARLRSASESFLVLDLAVPRGDLSGITLDVAGHVLPGSALLPTMPRFPEQTTTGGRDWRGYPQWWALRLDPDWLPADPGQPLRVELRARPGAQLVLGADRFSGQASSYEGPSFGDWPNLASSKLESEGDYRLPVRLPLASLATRSAVLDATGRFVPQRALHRIRLVTLTANEGWLAWRTPPLPRTELLALAFAGSSTGRGRSAELSLGEVQLRGFPLGAEEDFVLEQPPLRLCFEARGRRGEHAYGSYLLIAPGGQTGASLPMAVRFRTGMRDDPAFFTLDTRSDRRERARPGAGCPLPAGAALVDALGGDLDARHNTYPDDTGRWRVERVF